jgi:Domain of unknown function (DUF4388)
VYAPPPQLKPNLTDTPILSGRLRQGSLPSFLEYLSSSQHTGVLECEGPGEVRAAIWVQLGNIIRADCEAEKTMLSGLDAVRAVLRWRYAHVRLYDAIASVEANIKGSIISALLEAARLEDEASRERRLPGTARTRVRNNVSAYESLGASELTLLKRYRNGMTVQDLRDTMKGLPVDAAMLELHAQGIMEIEGMPPPTANSTAEFRALLNVIVPTQIEPRVRGMRRNPAAMPSTLHITVFDLVNGNRSAEQIRNELRLTPGVIRDVLKTLRQAGWVDY